MRIFQRTHTSDFYQGLHLTPSIWLARNDRFIFSTYEWGFVTETHMTIGYQWRVESLDRIGRVLARWSEGDSQPIGYDVTSPGEVFSFGDYSLLDGGDFPSPLINHNSNHMVSFGVNGLESICFSQAMLVASENPWPYIEPPQHQLRFFDFSDPNRIDLVAATLMEGFVGSVIRTGDILYEGVYNDSATFMRVLNVSDPNNLTVIGQLEAGFPSLTGKVGSYLIGGVPWNHGLGFYNVTDTLHPTLAASCTGASLRIFDRNDGTAFVLAWDERRVYLLDRIGLAVSGDHETLPSKCELLAYPNPFNSSLTIDFLSASGLGANLMIYDSHGREITRESSFTNNRWTWNAAGFPSGVYYLHLQSRDGVLVKPVTLLK